jgi:16S rRNA processing protein RimM
MSRSVSESTTEVGAVQSAPLVVLAVVRRPWGRCGELLVELQTDWPTERFASGVELRIKRRDGREVTAIVEQLRFVTAGPLLSLRDVDSISSAQPLAGATIVASAESLPRQPDVTLLHSDLTGMTLVDDNGQSLGVVQSIDESPAALLMVVRRLDGAQVLVPLVSAFLGEIDLRARRLVVSLPDGLLYPELAESAGGPPEA